MLVAATIRAPVVSVSPRVAPALAGGPESVDGLYVRSTDGGMVPLSAVTKRHISSTAVAITHQGQLPATTLSFNLAPGITTPVIYLALDRFTLRRLRGRASMPPASAHVAAP